MEAFAPQIERMMKRLFASLNEADRRRYAAIEAAKLGHGGVELVARVLGCDPKTIQRGIEELEGEDVLDPLRIRKKGGLKTLIEQDLAIEANFCKVLEDHTAGDPMRVGVKWTNLFRRLIAKRMGELGTPVSRHIVSELDFPTKSRH